MKTLQSKKGFTLIEVLVAVVILTIGVFSLIAMQTASVNGNSLANNITAASTIAIKQTEDVFAMDYDLLVDTDGDGTGQDTNGDGLDNSGGNFGLDDTLCCPDGHDPFGNAVAGCVAPARADGCTFQPVDGKEIYWNVAVDVPMPLTKTVYITVQWGNRGITKSVVHEYIQAWVVK